MSAVSDHETPQRRGRPRSAESEKAILGAALDLLAEGQGPSTISISAIARRAGAGKDTIYRRWPCKEDLLLEALASQMQPIQISEGAGLREALVVALTELITRMQSERNRRILRSLQGADEEFPKLRERYREQVISRRHEVIAGYVRAAQDRGELRAGLDPSGLAAMPFNHVVLSALQGIPVSGEPRQAAERLIDVLLHGMAAPD
jgi:AcrR family transcriptional regulator